jgi:sugar O-acyltransferase (sialic acid O-acetyltransferase NeuD family)
MNDIYIYGASGHGKVVLEAAQQDGKRPIAFIDDDKDLNYFEGLPVIRELPKGSDYIIAIGCNTTRKLIHNSRVLNQLVTVTHPNAVLSKSSLIGIGTFVGVNALINPAVIIGCNCIVNSAAVIEHDCIIEDYVHISPNATICGHVKIGKGTHIGAGAVIIPGIKIGAWCTIGAGAVVLHDIPDGATVVGNPGRIIKLA